MFDDLRQQADQADRDENQAEDEFISEEDDRYPGGYFLGMTPPQRFIISIMLLIMVCLLGTLFMLVTGKIWPTFI